MSKNLGSEFIFAEILPILPAKSLGRFKCVSKSFKSLISSPHFAKLYLSYNSVSISSSSMLLILPDNDRVICFNFDSTTSTVNATFSWSIDASVYVVGSSNGLLCILIYSDDIHYFCVLNPTTRRCHEIPPMPDNEGEGPGDNLGFAFDPDNLDFKIVDVSDIKDDGKVISRVTKVYCLNTNSWTVTETELPEDVMIGRHDSGGGKLINNNLLHWPLFIPKLLKRKIVCFDVCKDKWICDVLFPHYYYDPSKLITNIDVGVLDDCLSSSFENWVDRCYDVWVMKVYGVQDSWYKLYNIPFSNDLQDGFVPIACLGGSGEVLIRQNYWLLWYNRNNGGELTDANFDGAPHLVKPQVCLCNTSLIDLPGGKLFEDR